MRNLAAESKPVANKEKLVDIQRNNTFKRAFLKSIGLIGPGVI